MKGTVTENLLDHAGLDRTVPMELCHRRTPNCEAPGDRLSIERSRLLISPCQVIVGLSTVSGTLVPCSFEPICTDSTPQSSRYVSTILTNA